MKETPVSAFIPVNVPSPFFRHPYTSEEWEQATDEFAAIPADVFTSNEDLIASNAKVRVFSDKDSQEFRRSHAVGFVSGHEARWSVRVVAVSAAIKLRDFSILKGTAKIDVQTFHDEIATMEFGLAIKRWLIASLLAKPGILSFSDVIIGFRDALLEREEGPLGLPDESLEAAREMSWPPLANLSSNRVWVWLQKISDFNADFGLSKVGIAIAAFTHLLGRRRQTEAGENLFWALLGLEALYTTGAGDLTSQLVTKTQLLLGEQKKFKKIVRQMYHYRSRFVHGDIQIPMRYCHYDNTRSYRLYADEIHRYGLIATNVLISTLQTLVSRSWTNLSFAWSVVEPPLCEDEICS